MIIIRFVMLCVTWLPLCRIKSKRSRLSSNDGPSSNETLEADLRVHWVWQPQVDVLFDVRVVDTNAPFRTPLAVLRTAESEK